MQTKCSILLAIVSTLVLVPAIAGASVDIESGGNRVTIGRNGHVYIRNQQIDDDLDAYDDHDWQRHSNQNRWQRHPWRTRHFRRNGQRCVQRIYSSHRRGSISSSSTIVCQ